MSRTTSIFLFILNGAAWSRILTELRDSGLFTNVHHKMRDLVRAIANLARPPTLAPSGNRERGWPAPAQMGEFR